MIELLNIYYLHHDLHGSDCTMNSFRQQTRDKRHALCNCSTPGMQSANDQTLSHFVLDGNKLMH